MYRLTTVVAYGMSVLPMTPIYNNYTYELKFFAPALKCGSVPPETQPAFDEVLGGDWEKTGGLLHFYEARVPPSNNHVFDNELWIRVPTKNLTCQTWNVSYTARMEFQNGAQSIVILQQQDLERFIGKSESYPVSPTDDPPDAFGYRSWMETITSVLNGSLAAGGPKLAPQISTKVLNTGLVGCPEIKPSLNVLDRSKTLVYEYYCRNGTLEKAIEDLSRNVTFSLFGYASGV